jgi:putative ABC transport system permease protein
LTARIALPQEQYPDPASRRRFMERLTAELAALPAIAAFGTVDSLPFSFSRSATSFAIEGDVESPEAPRHADIREITPGYFQTMGVPLRRGREVAPEDDVGAPGVAVVNEAFARRFFPGGDAIGRRIQIGSPEEVTTYGEPIWRQIVGVVGNVIHDDLTAAAAPEMYVPYEQHPSTRLSLALRTLGEPTNAIERLREAVLRVDPGQPVYDVLAMQARLERYLAVPRANAWLLGVFSAVALSLAVLGVASVVSYAVTQRTRELGIRVALGAGAASVVPLVLRQGMAPVAVGLMTGFAAAPLAGRLMDALLFRTDPTDPFTLLLPAALLATASLLACLLPARRALGVDPIQTLRAG